ncbi:MAG: group III truncated hemoglobin [Ferruginibacter sp.]|nr:group III truncated hemoglobin [Ferruginibacter sp.]
MLKDIECRADIELLITQFYEQVKKDNTIGYIFTDIVKLNWEHHIPIIVDFWETILLDNPVYKKNAMEVHYDLNKKIPLQPIHFTSWVTLFSNTIDELFIGPKAILAKTRAKGIADVMQFKISNINDKLGIKKI